MFSFSQKVAHCATADWRCVGLGKRRVGDASGARVVLGKRRRGQLPRQKLALGIGPRVLGRARHNQAPAGDLREQLVRVERQRALAVAPARRIGLEPVRKAAHNRLDALAAQAAVERRAKAARVVRDDGVEEPS